MPSTSAITGAGEPQPAQGSDRLDPLLTRAVPDPMRRRGTVPQPGLALDA
jgi:hypothetical protein